MWIELAQVLGCTVYEAQYRIDQDEFYKWLSYRERYGSLSVSTSLKWYGALTAYTNLISGGADPSKLKITDYLPEGWGGDNDDLGGEMTQEQAYNMMRSIKMMAEKMSGGRKGRARYRVERKDKG